MVLESTTYPGTTEELLLPLLEARGLRAGESVYVAFSPERLDPGNPRFKIREVPKLVGGVTPRCTRMAALLYRQIVTEVVEVSTPRVAELAKLYENTFRAVNIALANELALMCRHLGVSVWEVIDAAATKPFGFMPFTPGPGIGGHCIPVDPLYLSWKTRLSGYEARFIALADAVNRAMPGVVVALIADALNARGKPLKTSRILVLGVAYKRGIGDVRDCPAVEIIEELRRKGAEVRYADPYVPRLSLPEGALEAAKLTPELLQWSDAAVVLTDHAEFDYATVVSQAPLVVDTRNATRALGDAPGIVRL
jgi:UDP-N-acetyl-D-glucosamine dehydrogenase